jgi:hypothetical protein
MLMSRCGDPCMAATSASPLASSFPPIMV